MKSKILLSVVLFVLFFSANCQTKNVKPLTFGVGVNVGIPTGDLAPFFNLGYGIDLQGQYSVNPELALTLTAGYLDFLAKGGGNAEIGSIPVLAGLKYFFSDKIYGNVQAGVSLYTASGAGSAFTFAPGVGFKISEKIDLLLKYQIATGNDLYSIGYLGVRVGLRF